MPASATEVRDYLAQLAPPSANDEGLRFGDPLAEVKGIVVAWMATPDAILAAVEAGANLMIVHEALFYPYDVLVSGGPADWLTWPVNLHRAGLLAAHGITVIRAHITLDRATIFDDFATTLGLPKPTIVEDGLVKLYDVEPRTLAQLAGDVKRALGLAAIRVTPHPPDRLVRRIGLPWGGLGLFVNVGYMQKLVVHRPDTFIAGETDNYGLRFAIESGIAMIETSHEASENPGLRHFADILAERFPGTPVTFFENTLPYRVL